MTTLSKYFPALADSLLSGPTGAQVDALKRLEAETVAELDALLPAVPDKAFKGEL